MRRVGTLAKSGILLIGLLVTLIVIVMIAADVLEDRVRAYAEQEINNRVADYEVHIGGLTLSPLWLVAHAADVTIRHKQHPEPTLLELDGVRSKIRWSGLLTGKVMADLRVESPTMQVSRVQL